MEVKLWWGLRSGGGQGVVRSRGGGIRGWWVPRGGGGQGGRGWVGGESRVVGV